MSTTEPSTKGKVAEALSKAQGAFKTLTKSRTAKVPMKAGGQYSYNYADLSDVFDCCRDALKENGLAVSQGVEGDGVASFLWHSSGEFLTNWVPLHAAQGSGPQAFGSSLTYARRYGLTSLLGIVAEEDDDAQSAQGAASSKQGGQAQKPPQNATQAKSGAASRPSQADYPKANPGWQNEPCTEAQRKRLWALGKETGWTEAALKETIKVVFKKDSSKDLTKGEIQKLFEELESGKSNHGSESPH